MAAGRDNAETRLVRIEAAETGGNANRAGEVAAEVGGGQAGRNGGSASARGAAGCAREVIRIAGGAVDGVIGLQVLQQQRHVGLAEHHRTSRLQALDGDRGVVGDAVLENRVAPGGLEALDVEGLLHRHRDAMQRAPGPAFLQRTVSGFRTLSRALEVAHDHRVQRTVVFFDAGDVVVEQFERGDLPRAQLRGEGRGGRKGDVCGHGGPQAAWGE